MQLSGAGCHSMLFACAGFYLTRLGCCLLQKRLERLQLGGVAQNNDGAVAIVQISSSMPNTPGSTRAAGLAAAAVSSGFASPTAAQAAAGSGSFGRAVSGSSNSSMAETSLTSSQPRPWSGSGLRYVAPGNKEEDIGCNIKHGKHHVDETRCCWQLLPATGCYGPART